MGKFSLIWFLTKNFQVVIVLGMIDRVFYPYNFIRGHQTHLATRYLLRKKIYLIYALYLTKYWYPAIQILNGNIISNDLTMLNEYMKKAHEYVEVALPRNYPVFGEDAFETGTGVHASAVIKAMKKGDHWLADRVYSGVPAGEFGLEQVIRIGHMAGRSNIIWWLQQRNYEVTDELVAHLFDVAKSQRRLMDDSEVVAAIDAFNNQ